MILIFLFFIFTISGIGIYQQCLKNHDQNNNFYCVADLSKGFILSYSIFCLLYSSTFFGYKINYSIAAILISIYTLIGVILFIKNQKTIRKNLIIQLAAITTCVVLPSTIMGNTPFLVSDSWSHLSIINRFLDEQAFTLSSFSMPNDNFLLKYSPHHGFLALSAYISHQTALDTFKIARVFYPVILCCSFLGFIKSIDAKFELKAINIFIAVIAFAILFPITDGVWRGSADYRIPSYIIMFELLSVIWLTIQNERKPRLIEAAWLCLIAFASAITHAFELAFACLMILPYGLYYAWKNKSTLLLFKIIAISITLTTLSSAALIIANSADAPLVKGLKYTEFFNYYRSQLNTHVTYTSFFTALLFAIILPFKNKKIKNFLMVSLISSLIFGPLNPLLFPLYDSVMGSSHSNRMMYGFPFYLCLIFSIIYLIDFISKKNSSSKLTIFLNLTFLIIGITSVMQNLYIRGGLDGEFTYKQNDSTSQLFIYPNLYAFLNQYHNTVIISDVFTSAPITAVTNNYVFTNRPWTGDGRIAYAKTILLETDSIESIAKICEYNIQLLLDNKNIPASLQKVMEQNTWVHDEFYKNQDYSKVKFLHSLGAFDGVVVYKIDRGAICPPKL